jgi:drug/metabolite transporter (DMT)-like permease
LKNSNYPIVVALALISTLAAAFMASGVKYLSYDLNPFTICFFRCLVGLIIVFPFVARNKFIALKTKNIKLQFFRSFINVISMLTWFTAIGIMQLEKATVLGFTTPLFTTILAVIILGEVIRFHRITALLLGFVGVLIVIRPGYLSLEYGTILMLIASLSFSFVLIMVKKLSQTDSSLTIIFYHLLFMTPITFLVAIFFWEGIEVKHLLLFVLMASSGLIAHWCMAQSLKLSDTIVVMPLQFTKLIWASLIGFYIFLEKPDIWTWFGASIIFISVIYITYRETFIKQKTPTIKQVDTAIID